MVLYEYKINELRNRLLIKLVYIYRTDMNKLSKCKLSKCIAKERVCY